MQIEEYIASKYSCVQNYLIVTIIYLKIKTKRKAECSLRTVPRERKKKVLIRSAN